jgi:hypothetical protein
MLDLFQFSDCNLKRTDLHSFLVDCPHVSPQVGHNIKGPFTHCATERFFLAVHQHVLLQLAL